MGSWSTGIMGGDLPYDFKDEIYFICDTQEFEEEPLRRILIDPEKFQEKMDYILKYIDASEEDRGEGYLVLGVMMMESGAKISDDLKEMMIMQAEEDDWARTDASRARVIDQFIESVKSYDNVNRIVLRTPGLFETIGEHLNGGNERSE